VNARDENGLAVLCLTTSTTSDSTLSACGHVPDSGGLVGTFPGWIMVMPSSVRAQRSGSSDISSRDPITDAVICLHWLHVPQRIEFKLTVLTYKFLFNQAPHYLGPLVCVADLPGRRALRSANTDRLLVPSVRLSSAGGRAFPVAAPGTWNDLPNTVQSLHSFMRRLKTYLVQRSFPHIIVTPDWTLQ